MGGRRAADMDVLCGAVWAGAGQLADRWVGWLVIFYVGNQAVGWVGGLYRLRK